METKSFVKLLRKVIREEVRSAVKSILSEQKTNHKQVMSHGMNLSNIASNPKTKREFSKNGMLNDILNETAYTADFANMREGPMVIQDMHTQINQPLTNTGINGESINMNNENVAKTVDVMSRDYSGLMSAMKKMDKSKGKKVV